LRARGIEVRGVRLDSGDLGALAREVRAVLDAGGLEQAIIFASGNLDEYRVQALARTPIDSFGVGTSLVTSADAPYLDAVYKLQEYAGKPRRKRSAGKATWPGRKQVYREYARDGTLARDVVTLDADRRAGEPLLVPAMRDGRRVGPASDLAAIRAHTPRELERLPPRLRTLADAAPPYPVEIAPALAALAATVDRATGGVTEKEEQ